MTFDGLIEKIMPLIEDGSKEPFIIYRDEHGDWQCSNTQNQYGDTYEWVEDVMKQDPFAAIFTGADFAHGSYPYVYDRILNERLRAEYESTSCYGADRDELKALMNLLEENIGEFSHEVTEYLTMFDRPLNALFEMTPIELKSNDPDFEYDHSKIGEFVQAVEDEVRDRLHNRTKQEIPKGLAGSHEKSDKPTKRNISGYEEIFSVPIAGKHVVLAEHPTDSAPYLVYNVKSDNVLNIEESYNDEIFADYIDALRGFVNRVDDLVYELEAERNAFGLAT